MSITFRCDSTNQAEAERADTWKGNEEKTLNSLAFELSFDSTLNNGKINAKKRPTKSNKTKRKINKNFCVWLSMVWLLLWIRFFFYFRLSQQFDTEFIYLKFACNLVLIHKWNSFTCHFSIVTFFSWNKSALLRFCIFRIEIERFQFYYSEKSTWLLSTHVRSIHVDAVEFISFY